MTHGAKIPTQVEKHFQLTLEAHVAVSVQHTADSRTLSPATHTVSIFTHTQEGTDAHRLIVFLLFLLFLLGVLGHLGRFRLVGLLCRSLVHFTAHRTKTDARFRGGFAADFSGHYHSADMLRTVEKKKKTSKLSGATFLGLHNYFSLLVGVLLHLFANSNII
jgi:hypothetical protein